MNNIYTSLKNRKISSVLILLVLCTFTCPIKAAVWTEPNRFDVNTVEGCIVTETLTIGNDGLETLDFMIRTRQVAGSEQIAGDMDSTSGEEENNIFSVPKNHDFTVLGDAPYKPGELIVRFAAKTDGQLRTTAEKDQILSSLGGGTIKRNFNIVPGLSVVELPGGITVEEALKTFNKADGILYAEANYEVEAISTFPNDPRFDDLWGMHNTGQTGGTVDADIDAPEAWDIGTGSSEIIVAVIDTGVDYTHPDLAANMWTNEAELNGMPDFDDDGNGYVDDIYGYDFRNNDGNPMDDHYHGTHCAGTVGGVGNNGEGVAGVNWVVRIMALKFLSSGGSGYTSDAILCVEYSTLMGANLSSNSWGGGSYNQGLKDAIDAAGAANMLFVAAAGNDSENTDVMPHYPSSYDCESLISVMSTDKYDNRSGFSNWGEVSVDLGAPGSDILSCQLGGGYRYLSGTSMATPHVAGACALLWSMNPVMSNSEVKDILIQTVDETLPGLCVSDGRLNLYNAILETKAPWIELEPEEGMIGPGGTIDINVTFDAMELAPGVYEAEIVIISNDPCSPATVPVVMTISPDNLQVSPSGGFDSSGREGGPFEPRCVVYTLTNNSDTESVYWTTWETENWLSVELNEGLLDPCDSIGVSVCISENASLLDPNIYTEILTFQNADSNSIKSRPISLTIKPPDCFTESFYDTLSDLEGLSVTFIPDGTVGYYEACREKTDDFPTDPNGGTYVGLWDDDFIEVFLGDQNPKKKISFYGTQYNRFYIGSNGYITFESGDTEYETSLENHFNKLRISGIFTDLSPQNSQCISYKKLGDRTAVTFEEVQLFGDKNTKNSFQIEMFYTDGVICITWLDIAEANCVAGLSRGRGLPPAFFEESDLGGYPPCWPWCDFDRDYFVNFTDFALFGMNWLEEDCGIPYWCGRSDLDFSGKVGKGDVGVFAEDWLMKVDWFLQPISHWKFDEGIGNIAYDSAGDNDGNLIGDTNWVAGKIGDYALEFDGSGDYVNCGNDRTFNITDQITMCAWVKPTDIVGDEFIASKWGVTEQSYGFRLEDANPRFFLQNNSGKTAKTFTDLSVTGGSWSHIAVVWTGTYMKAYLNAIESSQFQSFSGPIKITSDPVVIGYNAGYGGGSGGGYFNGTIDDVRIYDRSLSAEEIEELYREGLGHKAFKPKPTDGAAVVDPNVVLSWSPGIGADSHDVYLGTNFDDVNEANTTSPQYMGNFDVNSFGPCGLELGTTYYWRIDERDNSSTYKGDVWSFTTWVKPNLVGWWEFEEGSGTVANDSSGSGNDGTLVGPPSWVAGKIGSYALEFDGSGDYVEIPDNDIFDVNDVTVAFWMKSFDSGRYVTPLINYDTGVSDEWYGFEAPTGTVIRFLVDDGSAITSAQSTTNVFDGGWYFVTGTRNSALVAIYINGQFEDSVPETAALIEPSMPLWIGGQFSQNRFFNGIIDDVRIYDRVLSAEEIEELYREGLGYKAFNPNPADGAAGVDPNVVLEWSPGKDADSHNVYLGTDFNDVNDANTTSPQYMGNFDVNSFGPCGLGKITTYYWRIDEVNDSNIYKGDVWSFTTWLKPSLIGWWEFEEGSGGTAYDSAGNNDGNLFGDTNWVTGKIGNYALVFDGNDDYVSIPNSTDFDFGTEDFTISVWFKTSSSNNQHVINFSQYDNDPHIEIYNNYPSVGYVGTHLLPGYVRIGYQGYVNDNQWHHAAITLGNGELNGYKLYLDGQQRGQNTYSESLQGWDSISIGARQTSGSPYYDFDGEIDDVRVYDRVLSAEEIQQLYLQGL